MYKEVCFVVNELYPFHKGGIGRFIYNMLKENWHSKVNFSVVLYGENFKNLNDSLRTEMSGYFSGVATLYFVDSFNIPKSIRKLSDNGNILDSLYVESYLIYKTLKEIEENGKSFDFIEFIDFKGPALVSLNAKKTTGMFDGSSIGVRLHSTNSIISYNETSEVEYSLWHNIVHDFERKSLDECDYVVAHLDSIANYNKDFYGFGDAWLKKLFVNTPPTLLDQGLESVSDPITETGEPVFVFSSRIAPFKRPDLFIDAAVKFLDQGNSGLFYLVSYGWDQNYVQRIFSRIPDQYSEKIVFFSDLDEKERLKIIQDGIVVIPSQYESYCFFAYESLMRGSRILLNSQCLAFANSDFWENEKNCIFFDGNAEALAQAMVSCLNANWEVDTCLPEISTPYWELDVNLSDENIIVASGKTAVLILDKGDLIYSLRVDGVFNDSCDLISVGGDLNSTNLGSYRNIKDFLMSPESDKYEYIMVLDQGVVPDKDYIDSSIEFLNKCQDWFGAVPKSYRDVGAGEIEHIPPSFMLSSLLVDPDYAIANGGIYRRSFLKKSLNSYDRPEEFLAFSIIRALISGNKLMPILDAGVEIQDGGSFFLPMTYRQSVAVRMLLSRSYESKFKMPLSSIVKHVHTHSVGTDAHVENQLKAARSLAVERLNIIDSMSLEIEDRDTRLLDASQLAEERLATINNMSEIIAKRDQLDRSLWYVLKMIVACIFSKPKGFLSRLSAKFKVV